MTTARTKRPSAASAPLGRTEAVAARRAASGDDRPTWRRRPERTECGRFALSSHQTVAPKRRPRLGSGSRQGSRTRASVSRSMTRRLLRSRLRRSRSSARRAPRVRLDLRFSQTATLPTRSQSRRGRTRSPRRRRRESRPRASTGGSGIGAGSPRAPVASPDRAAVERISTNGAGGTVSILTGPGARPPPARSATSLHRPSSRPRPNSLKRICEDDIAEPVPSATDCVLEHGRLAVSGVSVPGARATASSACRRPLMLASANGRGRPRGEA